MKLLIFGAGGQVGTALQSAAWPSGTTITALTHAQADIGDAAAVAAAFDSSKYDIVINAAGYTAVDKAESEPAVALRINGEAPGLIAAECTRRGAALIHVSTDYVFDGAKPAPYLETDATTPLGVYGASKLAGERAVAEPAGTAYHPAHELGVQRHRRQFRQDHAAPRRRRPRHPRGAGSDRRPDTR